MLALVVTPPLESLKDAFIKVNYYRLLLNGILSTFMLSSKNSFGSVFNVFHIPYETGKVRNSKFCALGETLFDTWCLRTVSTSGCDKCLSQSLYASGRYTVVTGNKDLQSFGYVAAHR